MSFKNILNQSIKNIAANALNGKFDTRIHYPSEKNLFGDGVSINIGEGRFTAIEPKERNITTLSPRASILIKKKAFSTFKHVNDLQWMDRTEKMLLRATKALFAFKVAQIRAYESLTKFEDFFSETSEISLSLLADLVDNARLITTDEEFDESSKLFQQVVNAIKNTQSSSSYNEIKEDILLLLERNKFANDLSFTTWIVDPNSLENYGTGPGTGVIEIGLYSSFNTQTNLNTEPSSADFQLEDPYRIMTITEEDIELAIDEALAGTIGLLSELGNQNAPSIDAKSILGAGAELLGVGNLDGTINVNYIRDRLRVFYLGKPFINPGDAVHFYIRGNKTLQDFSLKSQSTIDPSYSSIDDSVFEAERILFTNGRIDLDTYKNIRQYSDNSFGMYHVFGGYVVRTSETWSSGSWVLKVSCVDNMGWLQWSRFMLEPALQDPQGILEDPLTPYEIKTDDTGRVLSANGPQLLEENKRLINEGLLYYDSGILNGQVATENNLIQGQYNKSGSLSGKKVLQHPQGLVYRWKQGIITATANINVVDPLNEGEVTQKLHNQVYGLTVAEDVLNNLDIANILSLLIVGQPYNVETFINQAYQAHNISRQSSSGALNNTDPLSAVIDVIRRQNNYFGNFRPYRMITMSSQTLLQTANNNILRNNSNEKIRQLQKRRASIDDKIRKLTEQSEKSKSSPSVQALINTLNEERRAISYGIRDIISKLKDSGAISSTDIITHNFNLFGNNRVLPLTNNFEADHQVTRAMTLVGAQRRIEDVRLNRDQNLFIVSDQYDEQTDIRPFIFKLRDTSYKIFNGNFVSVYNKCSEASKIINLEFFTNTQGHLEFRPPQWNRTPLSILRRLFDINKNTDKNIVPSFLTEVFSSRSDSLRREIHSLNIRIVILSLLLNKYPDRSLIPNLDSVGASSSVPKGTSVGKKSLRFFGVRCLGDDDELALRSRDYRGRVGGAVNTGNQVVGSGITLEAGLGENGDLLNGNTTVLLGSFDPVFQESTSLVNDILNTAIAGSSESAIKIANASNLNDLRESFVKLSGLDPASDLVTSNGKFNDSDFIYSKNNTSINAELDNIEKADKYLKKLEQTISKRDNLVTILQRNIEKQKELDEVEDILSGEITAENSLDTDFDRLVDVVDRVANTSKTISDIFAGNATTGSLFDHLVADDTRNMLGPGSGRRYIISDDDIISCSFTEEPPDFVKVDVVGNAPVIGESLRRNFEERYFWAGATDFDLWRQYGYKYSGKKNIPFASDAEQQSKPWAILELQLQRLKINQGTLTLVGNEYYSPGDTVYVESKQLLYYVRSVSHSYSMGSNFTTTLNLEFGHPPGTYLPSPLDIIGQQYTKDPLTGTFITYRNSYGDDNYRALQPDSSIVFPNTKDNFTEDDIPLILDYKNNAIRFTNIMADLSSILIGNRVVLIRGFVKSRSSEEVDRVRNNIKIIKYMLQNPVSLVQENPTSTIDDIIDIGSSVARGLGKKTGSTKGTVSMRLPNGLPTIKIPAEKIAEQIVYLDKKKSVSEIQSLNPTLLSSQIIDGKSISDDEALSIFPKGGPKQGTWLDIRSESNSVTVFKVSNVIEIGILNLQREVNKGIKKKEA